MERYYLLYIPPLVLLFVIPFARLFLYEARARAEARRREDAKKAAEEKKAAAKAARSQENPAAAEEQPAPAPAEKRKRGRPRKKPAENQRAEIISAAAPAIMEPPISPEDFLSRL